MKKIFAISGVINYIIVIFLNAFTDLGHKIIIQNTIFKVYDGELLIILTAVVNALILLPYILIFSPSGFLADRFAKNKIMEYSAGFAVVITLFITYAYYNGLFFMAFTMTFLLALQSAIYGPAKYGYIKELFGVKFIAAGNGIVQAVTTVAILGGIIFYTVLFESGLGDNFSTKEDVLRTIAPIGWLLVVSSVVEWFLASKLPNKMLSKSQKKFDFKKYLHGVYLYKNLKIVKRKKEIFDSIIAISLFWSISQVVLAVFGEYAKSELNVTNTILVQGVMALAGIGIVIGSIIASKLSRYYINTGFSTIGALGIVFVVFLIPVLPSMKFVAVAFTLFGVFAGFLLVSLNSLIQYLSPNVHLGTILAGNNFIQNIFMFVSLALTTIFAYFGMNAKVLFYVMGFVGIYLFVLLYKRFVVMSFWAFLEVVLRSLYKIEYIGLENISHTKGVLLLGNHVSWIDWVVLQFGIKKRINFLMDKDIYNWKFFHHFFKKGEAIPISPKASKDAFREAKTRLKNSKIVALFPEGGITQSGKIEKFHRGYEMICKDVDSVIVPFFIDGVFGSVFSKYKPKKGKISFKRRVIRVYFAKPVPKETKADELQKIVENMKDIYETK